ncbi:MAG: thioredoxin family protein [Chloroflexota bacterium]
MNNQIVSREDWLDARKALLEKEKEFTRLRDELSQSRREMPWVKIEKEYQFDSNAGQVGLSDLFNGRSQLLIYHFMFGVEWEEGCPSCSFWADGYNGTDIHLNHRDISFAVVSSAKLDKLNVYKARMGWTFNWVSSFGSEFNQDFHVTFSEETKSPVYNYRPVESPGEELPGLSAFYKNDAGELFHTYSTYARGMDMLNATYHHMDLMPKGRDEANLPWSMAWLRRRDQYES